MATRSGHVSLIVKGPIKAARRAAQRYGLSTRECVDLAMASGKPSQRGDIQCYVPCSSSTNRKVVDWYTERNQTRQDRGYPGGTLLYHGSLCPTKNLGRRKRRKKRSRR